ncbi:hypothetical protein L9F63_011420 [Diploptera punctata]|uniref:Uncharacterized protein n=1 Tax=Diploptera punctata TaxID=6984 RepID=A0AAD8AEQ2_DIPPU|nr:hypothetical protein L9F63_011420 [Diploptera punctata]
MRVVKMMMVVLFLLLNANSMFCILNIPFEDKSLDKEISKSILEISRRYFSKLSHVFIQSLSMERTFSNIGRYNDEYLLMKMHNKLEIPVIMYKYSFTWKTKKPEDAQALVFILPKTNFEMQIRVFKKFMDDVHWEILYPRVYVVVVSPFIPASYKEVQFASYIVLNLIWLKLREANVIYIIPVTINDSFALLVYSWFPDGQSQPVCLKELYNITRVDLWSPKRSNFTRDTDLFPSKVIKDMGACSLLVSLYNMPPYILIASETKLGYLMEILSALSKTNRISLKLHEERMNENTMCDICLPLPLGSNIYTLVRKLCTYPHIVFSHSWYVPIIPIPKWQSIIRILNFETWIMVAVTYLLGTITFWLLKGGNDLVRAFIDTLRTFLCFGIADNFQGVLSIFYFSVWLYYCLHINTAYQSCLISFMAEPGIYPPISDLHELLSSEFAKESSILFEGENNLLNNLPYCGNSETCIDRMIRHKQTATYAPTLYTDMILKYVSIDRKRPEIISLKPASAITHYSAKVDLGPLLTRRIDHITQMFFSAGIIDYSHKQIYRFTMNTLRQIFPPKETIFALNFWHLLGAFFLLLAGHILACIAFVTEVLMKAYKKRNQKN